MTIVLATRNIYKAEEMKTILGPDFNYRMMGEFFDKEIKEIGRSLLENSFAKALFCYKLSGLPSLADDSGLFVDSLDGAPGIYSSRYGRNDGERIDRLLMEMMHEKDRRARFKAVFVFYFLPNKYRIFDGVCDGEITQTAQGSAGFGYDPVFVPQGYKKTFAELGPDVKNRISHRAQALIKLRGFLHDFVRNDSG